MVGMGGNFEPRTSRQPAPPLTGLSRAIRYCTLLNVLGQRSACVSLYCVSCRLEGSIGLRLQRHASPRMLQRALASVWQRFCSSESFTKTQFLAAFCKHSGSVLRRKCFISYSMFPLTLFPKKEIQHGPAAPSHSGYQQSWQCRVHRLQE